MESLITDTIKSMISNNTKHGSFTTNRNDVNDDDHTDTNTTMKILTTVATNVHNGIISTVGDVTSDLYTDSSEVQSISKQNEGRNLTNTLMDLFPTIKDDEDSASFSVQDKVIMGAAITVGLLAILAVVLRFTMPLLRMRLKKCKPEIQVLEDLYDEKTTGISEYAPYTLPVDTDLSQSSSQSDQSQSSTQSDWSDSSSNHTKSTYYSSDSYQMTLWKAASFGNLMGSTLSLPVCLPSERGALSRSQSTDGLNAKLMTALSRQTYSSYAGSNDMRLAQNPSQDLSDDRASTKSVKTTFTTGSTSDGLSDGPTEKRTTAELNPLFKQCYNNKYKSKLDGTGQIKRDNL